MARHCHKCSSQVVRLVRCGCYLKPSTSPKQSGIIFDSPAIPLLSSALAAQLGSTPGMLQLTSLQASLQANQHQPPGALTLVFTIGPLASLMGLGYSHLLAA